MRACVLCVRVYEREKERKRYNYFSISQLQKSLFLRTVSALKGNSVNRDSLKISSSSFLSQHNLLNHFRESLNRKSLATLLSRLRYKRERENEMLKTHKDFVIFAAMMMISPRYICTYRNSEFLKIFGYTPR